jgi:endonuclease/exonuclease/phosphatase family metal-dependent hydrolase
MQFPHEIFAGLRTFPTLADLRKSDFFKLHGARLDAFLSSAEVSGLGSASPRLSAFLRVVQWNIEKGKQLSAIIDILRTSEVLRWADVILLNEADYGMNRSGNWHVARSIAEALGMHMVFAPAHIELTKGTEEDLILPGENRESLQGNAVLSRHAVVEARAIPLPVCFEPYEFHEKRYGRRNCVWARLRIGSRTAWFGSAHLEVRNTPRCRAAQMKYLLANLPGSGGESYLLGGDMNANGFPRGTRLRILRSIVKLLSHRPDQMKQVLLHPEWGSEPIFREILKAGWSWEGLNANECTAWAPIGGLEEENMLPRPLADAVRRRLTPYKGYLELKLDWLFARRVKPLRASEMLDSQTGISSRDPGCVATPATGAARISDHMPVFADVLV